MIGQWLARSAAGLAAALLLGGCSLVDVLGTDELARIEAGARVGQAQAEAAARAAQAEAAARGAAEAARHAAEASVAKAAIWAVVTPEITMLLVIGAVAMFWIAGMWWYRRRRLDLEIELVRSGGHVLPSPPRRALPGRVVEVIGPGAEGIDGLLLALPDPARRRAIAAQKLLALEVKKND